MANVLNTGKAVKKKIAFGVLDLKLKSVNPIILTTRVNAMDRERMSRETGLNLTSATFIFFLPLSNPH